MAMGQGSVNLLLGNAADGQAVPPIAGINYAGVVQWQGGSITVGLSGVVGGATFDLLYCIDYPANGELFEEDNITPNIPLTSWMPLALAVDAVGVMYKDLDLNPCLLAVNVHTPGGTTAVRIVVA